MGNKPRLLISGLTIVMFILSTITSYGQFLKKDAKWIIAASNYAEGLQTIYYSTKIIKDSIINDTTYSIFNYQGDLFALREDSGKVYYKVIKHSAPSGVYDTLEHVLYDFNLKVNDTIHILLPNNYEYKSRDWVVQNIDSVQIGNKQKKRLKLQMIPEEYLTYQFWIEDIGSTYGPLYFTGISEHEEGFELHCYRINNENLYGECKVSGINQVRQNAGNILLFNPEECRIKVNLPSVYTSTLNIYALTGIKVKQLEIPCNQFIYLNDLKKGFYIVEVNAGDIRYCKKIILF